jgi:hypothetical protein
MLVKVHVGAGQVTVVLSSTAGMFNLETVEDPSVGEFERLKGSRLEHRDGVSDELLADLDAWAEMFTASALAHRPSPEDLGAGR